MKNTMLAAAMLAAAAHAGATQFDSVAPFHLGMHLAQAEKAAGHALETDSAISTASCAFVRDPARKLDLLFTDGVLQRIYVEDAARAVNGLKIGDEGQKVRKHFGASVHAEAAPHDASSQSLFVYARDGKTGMRVEVDTGGHITLISLGRAKELAYIEECL